VPRASARTRDLASFAPSFGNRAASGGGAHSWSGTLSLAERKAFLLRLDPAIWADVERLAQADLRSVNAEIEYLLRDSLSRRGIKPAEAPPRAPPIRGRNVD
jgi:hypothetical protein